MLANIFPISALLFGSALLMFAGGINGLILPVRGTIEGFSAFSLGLLGTGWAIGYVAGCLKVPRLVSRVGHIRSFTALAALAAISILLSLLLMKPIAWILLRALSGFCFAGAAMIVESWLNERTEARARGRVFGLYTMINLGASTVGQLSLTLGAAKADTFFVLGAIIYCCALVPLAISSSATPKPLVAVHLDIPALWRNSPVAVFSVLMVGVSNGAFGTLAAVYAGKVGLVLSSVALFVSMPILAGAASQIPVGILSDRLDRRVILVGLGVIAAVADLCFIFLVPASTGANLLLVALFGVPVFAMYPVIVAHANDHASAGAFIQTSGGLLMIYGIGSIVGPLVAGWGMSIVGARGLFMTSLSAHLLIVLFALWRMSVRGPVPEEQKGVFRVSAPGRTITPETAALAEPH